MSKSAGKLVKCKCGHAAGKIVSPGSIGKLHKLDVYEENLLKGTPFRTVEEFRDATDAPNCEDLKRRMMRKYGDLAIGDDVRPNEGLATRMSESISRFTGNDLDEKEKDDVQQMEGVIKSANVHRDTYDVDWTDSARDIAKRYNNDKYDFFDLDGDWNSWDLNRVITQRDVGRVGRVESGNQGSAEVAQA